MKWQRNNSNTAVVVVVEYFEGKLEFVERHTESLAGWEIGDGGDGQKSGGAWLKWRERGTGKGRERQEEECLYLVQNCT